MSSHCFCPRYIEIRDARTEDIQDIAALVRTCGPYLSNHVPYLYWMYTRFFHKTCLVAVHEGRIVGWCSVIRVARDGWFMHQLAVSADSRGRGVAFEMFSYLIAQLRSRRGDDFSLYFTADRSNHAVHRLNRKVAAELSMDLQKLPDVIPAMEGSVAEDLYCMTPLRAVDVNVASALAIAA